MIVLDIETSGLSPTKHSLLSIGAVDYVSGEGFYGECRAYPGRELDPAALAVNGFTVAQCLDATKELPHSLYMRFLSWAMEGSRELLLAGQQVGSLDIPFLKAIAADRDQGITPPWPFGYRSVDLHSVAYVELRRSLSLDGILEAVGLQAEPKPHNALVGAKLEREALLRLLG